MNIELKVDYGLYGPIDNLKFILIDEADVNNIEFDNNTALSYNTEDYGTTFFLSADNPNRFVLVADYSDCSYTDNTVPIEISGTINITVDQAEGTY